MFNESKGLWILPSKGSKAISATATKHTLCDMNHEIFIGLWPNSYNDLEKPISCNWVAFHSQQNTLNNQGVFIMAYYKPHSIWASISSPIYSLHNQGQLLTSHFDYPHARPGTLRIPMWPIFRPKTASQRDILLKETPVAASKFASEQSPTATVVVWNISLEIQDVIFFKTI